MSKREVTFGGGAAGIVLAGTVTLPKGEGAVFPRRCLSQARGPQDRDESLANHPAPFLLISDALTRKGIAVLRYDKRGRGQNPPAIPTLPPRWIWPRNAPSGAGLPENRAKEIDGSKIGLIGHSEGRDYCAVSGRTFERCEVAGAAGCAGNRGGTNAPESV